jgi:hypothetical protein
MISSSRLLTIILLLILPLSGSFFIQAPRQHHHQHTATITSRLRNAYDDWRSDAVAPVMPLDEDNVKSCLEDFIESDYGKTMFGRHDTPASYGITGDLEFVELQGPEVILRLEGMFWHRRDTVLGRAAMWLNACMPEITEVRVEDEEELKDFEEIRDEETGEILEVRDKRAPDFNGDRATMEYQGMDPDMRGPFPQGPMSSGGSMISPA